MKKSRFFLTLIALSAFAGAGYAAVKSGSAQTAANDCCTEGAACCLYSGCCQK